MVTVALAGASTGLGNTFLHTFLRLNASAPPDKQHNIIVLSRRASPELEAKGIVVRAVDYTSYDSLVAALKDVHTVLPLIGADGETMKTTQLALLAAAKEAGCKRFAPSEYAGNGYEGVDLYAGKAAVFEAVKASGLEYTRFNCGLFMSVLATGTPKPLTPRGESEGYKTGEEEALAGLRPWNFIVNMRAGTVDYPGKSGTEKIVLTDTRDVATFVYHALSLEHWPQDLGMRGDVVSWKVLVAISERVQNRKWLEKYTPVSEIEKPTEDMGARFYNQTRLAFLRGWGMVGNELNGAFPEIKPIKAEEFVEKWWGGVFLPEARWEEMNNPM